MSRDSEELDWEGVSYESVPEAKAGLVEYGVPKRQVYSLFSLVDKRGREYVAEFQGDCPAEINTDVVVQTLKIGVAEDIVGTIVNDIRDDASREVEKLIDEFETSRESAFSSLSVFVGSKSEVNESMIWLANEIQRQNYERG